MLYRLSSSRTATRAPGPGAIKKTDWQPVADKYLRGRSVILHTDSARSYRLRLPGVVHDAVVHQKKRVKVRGRWVWRNPTYVRIVRHQLPSGKRIVVKAGTQVIDRAWKFLRREIGVTTSCQPGTRGLAARVRSAQWVYWQRGQDRWLASGLMMQHLLRQVH